MTTGRGQKTEKQRRKKLHAFEYFSLAIFQFTNDRVEEFWT